MSARRIMAIVAWLAAGSSASAQSSTFTIAPAAADGRGAATAFAEPPPRVASAPAPSYYIAAPYTPTTYSSAPAVAGASLPGSASVAAPAGPTTPLPPVDPIYTTGPVTPPMSDTAWGERPLYLASGDQLIVASNDLVWDPSAPSNSAAFVEQLPAFPEGESIPTPDQPAGDAPPGPTGEPTLLPKTPAVEEGDPPSTAEEVEAEEPIVWPALPPSWVEYWQTNPYIKFWSPSRLELGGTQTGGTKDSWTLLTRGTWNRETDRWKYTLEGTGRYTELNSVRSADEWIIRNNIDLKALDNPWLVFGKSSGEYDAIERVAPRIILSTGLGYRFLDEKDVRVLITRVGPTLTYERYYSPDRNDLKPELLVELEGKFAVGRMTLEHLTSVYPGFANGGSVRMKSTSGLLLPLDVKKLWSAKLGFIYNYNDQTNTNVKPYDYESSFSIVYNK